MNEDARYARHVLDLAAHCDEDDIRELGRKIAQHMRAQRRSGSPPAGGVATPHDGNQPWR